MPTKSYDSKLGSWDVPMPGMVAWLRDRRVVAIGESTGVLSTGVSKYPGQTPVGMNVTFPDLRKVEYVIDINLFTTPGADMCLGAPFNKKISGNIVGFTVVSMTGLASGTTIWAQAIAIGPP